MFINNWKIKNCIVSEDNKNIKHYLLVNGNLTVSVAMESGEMLHMSGYGSSKHKGKILSAISSYEENKSKNK